MEKILQKKKAMEELEKVAKYVLAENILILSKINQETPTCVSCAGAAGCTALGILHQIDSLLIYWQYESV